MKFNPRHTLNNPAVKLMVNGTPRANNIDRVRMHFRIDRTINLKVCPSEYLDLSNVQN
jgi:hypothetical protein